MATRILLRQLWRDAGTCETGLVHGLVARWGAWWEASLSWARGGDGRWEETGTNKHCI